MASGLQQLGGAIVAVKDYISKSYMQEFTIPSCEVLEINNKDRIRTGIRLLKIDQIVLSDELIESRLTSIYQTLNQLVNTCFMIIQGTKTGISLYIGFQSDAAGTAENALMQTLIGNFPGIIVESLNAREIEKIMSLMSSSQSTGLKTVASVSVVPSQREEQGVTENVQGMEKFIDTMQGKEFTAIIIATPYDDMTVNRKIVSLEAISTTLSSLEQITVQDSQSQTMSLTDSVASTISNTINTSISNAYSLGNTTGSFSQNGKGNAFTVTPLGLGISFSGQRGNGTTNSQTVGMSISRMNGTAIGRADMTSQALGQTQGMSRAVVKTETNKEVQNLRLKIDHQIERLRNSEAHGVWDCCGYFIANNNDTAIIAANSFQGLVTGDATSIEQSVISLWQPTLPSDPSSNHENIRKIVDSLSVGIAPVFCPGGTPRRMESVITGKELSRMMGFPRKSAGTVSVIHMAAFGRNIHLVGKNKKEDFDKKSFPVGKIVHMGRVDGNEETRLEMEKLNAHMLAVGATGVGKTTAICDILFQLNANHIPFTVIEPAKGEYGELWGKLQDIDIYSTTPFRYRMLKINPFAFEESVHILNHMERLISVFSTAWPLYAAQPAILRDCVRMAYVKCGWDITNSICLKKRNFPTFSDVLNELPEAIRRSRFVGESKGTYEGALQTRLSMLTEGVFKDLFCGDYNISDTELFDRNVIIDLSRLGSPETLSLVMGILLIRLYEHRLSTGKQSRLRHVTVLEEAHNILKKSPNGPQGEDVSSIATRSVEVLTKCITELRFTGEGFIIADQSPSELDATAIKNTSTKIVMRLQDQDDQLAIGSALSLTDSQVTELSKLDKGVGAVFQEGWVEAVLTKFDYYQNPYSIMISDVDYQPEAVYSDICAVRGFLIKNILSTLSDSCIEWKKLERSIDRISNFSRWKLADYKALFRRYEALYDEIYNQFQSNRIKYPFYGSLIRELLSSDNLFQIICLPQPDKNMNQPYSEETKFREICMNWKNEIIAALERYCHGLSVSEKEMVIKLLLLADGENNKEQVLVCSTVFKKGK